MTKRPKTLYYSLAFSPDDGGWYAEIFSVDGKTLHITRTISLEHVTPILESARLAREWAKGKCDNIQQMDLH